MYKYQGKGTTKQACDSYIINIGESLENYWKAGTKTDPSLFTLWSDVHWLFFRSIVVRSGMLMVSGKQM